MSNIVQYPRIVVAFPTQEEIDATGADASVGDGAAAVYIEWSRDPERGVTPCISIELVAITNEYGTAVWVSDMLIVGSTQQIDDQGRSEQEIVEQLVDTSMLVYTMRETHVA